MTYIRFGMTGTRAFLWSIVFPAGISLFLLICSAIIFKNSRRRPDMISKENIDRVYESGAGLALAVIFALAVGWLCVSRITFYTEVKRLDAHDVESVKVGDRLLTDRAEITAIAESIDHADFFELYRGQSRGRIPFVIKLKSGKEERFEAVRWAPDRWSTGNGIGLISETPSIGEGEISCPDMRTILQKAGINPYTWPM